MSADRNTLGLALFYALVLLYLAIVPWRVEPEPRRFVNGQVVRPTCEPHDPMRSDACWSCHGVER